MLILKDLFLQLFYVIIVVVDRNLYFTQNLSD